MLFRSGHYCSTVGSENALLPAGYLGSLGGILTSRLKTEIRFCSFPSPRQLIPGDARRPSPLPPPTQYDGPSWKLILAAKRSRIDRE